MNYTELTAALKDFLENQESTFAAYIDRFIRLGERRIHMTLELPSARKNVTASMTANNRFLQLPSDVISVLDLEIVDGSGNHKHLHKVEEGFIQEAYPDPTSTAEPKYYSIYDHNTVLLGPTPNSNYTVEMSYHGVPESIVDAPGGTTWLGDNCDRALFYAALVEGYTFMKGDADMIAQYEKAYQEEVMKLNELVVARQHRDDLFDRMFSKAREV